MSRPPRPNNKRATMLLSDGVPRSVDELAEELGINVAEACEIIRSMTKQQVVVVKETVKRYGLNVAGLRRSTAYKDADAQGLSAAQYRQKKREYMRQKREAERKSLSERKDADGIVAQAMASRHVLAGVWA